MPSGQSHAAESSSGSDLFTFSRSWSDVAAVYFGRVLDRALLAQGWF
jgi:hypothetical protein